MIIDPDSFILLPNADRAFAVDSTRFDEIIKHLNSKGISAGGRYNDSSFSDVQVGVDLPTLNEALAELDE